MSLLLAVTAEGTLVQASAPAAPPSDPASQLLRLAEAGGPAALVLDLPAELQQELDQVALQLTGAPGGRRGLLRARAPINQ